MLVILNFFHTYPLSGIPCHTLCPQKTDLSGVQLGLTFELYREAMGWIRGLLSTSGPCVWLWCLLPNCHDCSFSWVGLHQSLLLSLALSSTFLLFYFSFVGEDIGFLRWLIFAVFLFGHNSTWIYVNLVLKFLTTILDQSGCLLCSHPIYLKLWFWFVGFQRTSRGCTYIGLYINNFCSWSIF